MHDCVPPEGIDAIELEGFDFPARPVFPFLEYFNLTVGLAETRQKPQQSHSLSHGSGRRLCRGVLVECHYL